MAPIELWMWYVAVVLALWILFSSRVMGYIHPSIGWTCASLVGLAVVVVLLDLHGPVETTMLIDECLMKALVFVAVSLPVLGVATITASVL